MKLDEQVRALEIQCRFLQAFVEALANKIGVSPEQLDQAVEETKSLAHHGFE